MNKSGPILIIEDDEDDCEIFRAIFEKLTAENELLFFTNGIVALDYLNDNVTVKPFLIISNVKLPKLSGIELRDKIHNNEQLRLRSVPYLFFTTSASHDDLVRAYSDSVQGFFIKPNELSELKNIIETLIAYWKYSTSPHYEITDGDKIPVK